MLLPTPWGYLPRQHNEKMNDWFYAIHSKSQKPENGTLKFVGFYYPDSKLTLEEQEEHAALLGTAHELLEVLVAGFNMADKTRFPTEAELNEFKELAKKVIKKARKQSIYE